LKEKGIFAHINTNGTLLSENTVKKLNDNRSINLMVSMHEFNNEDYYMVNRKGLLMTYGRDEELKAFKTKFTKKVANLKKIRNYKNLSLDFLTILSNKNILHFEKIYAW
jgi:sulfatase maturation enzyme AslB (radical SAM superfamily)